ncbi:family 43 glycosylhydrolase [Kitasatospora sp. NPDC048722]|uniref:family 43 glycosylhydrolase n=1 Tax=Kitasatospora sp. NPDC048722 TaxID=3155639 RepID=UPI0033D37217
MPCHTSGDLGTWTYQGVALAKQSSGDLGPNRVVERPKVIYNASTGTCVMYVHIDSGDYSEAKAGVATSSTPCGPYVYRGSFRPLGDVSRDLGLFQESDGTGYLLTEDRNNGGLRIDRLSADYLSVDSPVALLGGGSIEAPAMMKVGGTYYLLGSHLSGWYLNDNVYATATSPSGPWSVWRDLAAPGTNTYDSQTANIITVQGTSGTTYVRSLTSGALSGATPLLGAIMHDSHSSDECACPRTAEIDGGGAAAASRRGGSCVGPGCWGPGSARRGSGCSPARRPRRRPSPRRRTHPSPAPRRDRWEPTPDSRKFTFVVTPDTQYLFDGDRIHPAPLEASFRSVLDGGTNREGGGDDTIVFLARLGDVTEHGLPAEYAAVTKSFAPLDDAGVAYGVLAGNHDVRSSTDDRRGRTPYPDTFTKGPGAAPIAVPSPAAPPAHRPPAGRRPSGPLG